MYVLQRPEDHRRKWDKDEFEQLARLRAQLANEESGGAGKRGSSTDPTAPKRAPLEYRDYKVDLDSKLGKTQVVTKTTPLAQQGGLVDTVNPNTGRLLFRKPVRVINLFR